MTGDNTGVSRIIYALAAALFVVLWLPPVRSLFHDMGGIRWLHILLVSSTLTFIVMPVVIRASFRFNVLDIPDPRKIHSKPVPLVGGVAIYIAFIVSVLDNAIVTKEVIAIVISSSIVFLAGLFDDIMKLSSRLRLSLQLMAVAVLLLNGISIIVFKQTWVGIALNSLLTCLWIIGLTNSFNFFDGMDGLAAGLSVIVAFFIGVVAFQTYQPFLGWLAIAIMGGCIGFLPYNFGPKRPAEIFLGDSGSNFLGFTLASIAVMGEWSEKSAVSSLITPLLIFSIFIYDMIYITISRVATGKVHNVREWLDYVGQDHLHHRIADITRSKRKSVLLIYFLAFTLGLNALLLRTSDSFSALVLLAQAGCILIVFTIMEVAGNRNGENCKD
ncbi:MAG: undecaprenyl/decaprenyl-phosphate alpha-N-acetylglucosaminyl 1-phosphate transferase [Deltaproteobacteria bacterium]|nr:undecaprenyl/decaprenyl-phosphate alpha-N-acetylglucosaminyl 1-phosphate transferase [Deltaproteobacteria bacterium]